VQPFDFELVEHTMKRSLPLMLSVLATAAAPAAIAQPYPSKPVRVIVPFTAGGTTDILARILAQKLTESFGQTVVVENRVGAGGVVGMDFVAKSPPDGYTIVLGSTSSTAVNVALYPKMPYDPQKDLVPIMQVATGPFVLAVHPSLPVRNVKDLVALARARPGELNFGSSGNGTSLHLAAEMLKSMTGIRMTHVPYKGVSAAVPDLVAGTLQLMFSDMPAFSAYVKAGRLRAIAATTAKRSAVLPELPTIAESGVPGYEATSWYGFLASTGTSREVIGRFNAESTRALGLADVRERFTTLGVEPMAGTPEAFGSYVAAEIRRWGEVVKAAGVKLE